MPNSRTVYSAGSSDQLCRGFSFIELLTVVAVILLLSVVSVVSLRNFGDYAALRTAADGVVNSFGDAKNRTLAADSNTNYGVHIDSNKIVKFVGSSYSSTTPTNVEYELPGGVVATSSLTGGVVDVVFSRLTGEVSATGTITLSDPSNSASTTLTLYRTGLVE